MVNGGARHLAAGALPRTPEYFEKVQAGGADV